MNDQRIIRDGIATILDRLDPGITAALADDPVASLRLIASTAQLSAEADASVRGAVDSARAAGASWEQIGTALHVSRQAAQQRFGHAAVPAANGLWRMTPVTAINEMARLNEAGRYGWHSVGFGTLFHDLAPSDEQWEHRRVNVLASRHDLEAEGWQKIGTMWFPWAYYARPTGAPALPGPMPAAHA